MIDNVLYKEILDSGLSLDHFFLLIKMKEGEQIDVVSRRITGFINLLEKKGLCENGKITEKGLQLVENDQIKTKIQESLSKNKKKEDGFSEWSLNLHKKCQDKLYELTMQRQIRAKFPGDKKPWSFLPGVVDLEKVLKKTMTLYKLDDRDKIENTIMNYISTCAKANHWFPILQYYILKFDNSKTATSKMVADLESDEGNIDESADTSTQTFI
jgi:hypothetical protein